MNDKTQQLVGKRKYNYIKKVGFAERRTLTEKWGLEGV